MPQYHRLTVNEREEISLGLAQGRSRRDIAHTLGRYPSTISREIKRSNNCASCYRAVESQARADYQAHNTVRKIRKLEANEPLKQTVLWYLNQLWSPEQIAKRLKILYPNNMTMRVSHETIYKYLYVLPRGELRRVLTKCLRRQHTNRRTKNKVRRQSCPIQDFISIEERPAEVANRIVPGHWEGDLLAGHNNGSALGTLVERTTRMTFLVPLKRKDAMSVREAFSRQFRTIPDGLKRTLTYDHGQEMAQHKLFTKNTRIQVYFAHPHSPWERGTNENTNSLIRQFFPKGTDFSKISNKAIKKAQNMLNDRPRKTLEFNTPHEVFNKLLSVALET
jgi:transposase, IS30 family